MCRQVRSERCQLGQETIGICVWDLKGSGLVKITGVKGKNLVLEDLQMILNDL